MTMTTTMTGNNVEILVPSLCLLGTCSHTYTHDTGFLKTFKLLAPTFSFDI